MSKALRYSNLVAKFKQYQFLDADLTNPHNIPGFHYDVISPWELWQSNLDAEIMLIGQDYSDISSLIYNINNDWEKEKNCYTNQTLIRLLNFLKYDLKVDYDGENIHSLFFTNAILGIKNGNMSTPVKTGWWKETLEYLRELIDIVQPKYVIAMGRTAYDAICSIHNIRPHNDMKKAIGAKIPLTDDRDLFVLYHCSPLGKRNRPLLLQESDWNKVAELMMI